MNINVWSSLWLSVTYIRNQWWNEFIHASLRCWYYTFMKIIDINKIHRRSRKHSKTWLCHEFWIFTTLQNIFALISQYSADVAKSRKVFSFIIFRRSQQTNLIKFSDTVTHLCTSFSFASEDETSNGEREDVTRLQFLMAMKHIDDFDRKRKWNAKILVYLTLWKQIIFHHSEQR